MTKKRKAPPRWRAPFLRALGRTGNVRLAAEQAGVDHGTCYNHRRKDAEFAEEWEGVLEGMADTNDREAPLDFARDERGWVDPDLVLRHSKSAGAQLVKAGRGRWSVAAEKAFLLSLSETACIRRAARAVGFSTTAIHKRLNLYPRFADEAQAAIRQARADFESMVLSAGIATFDPGPEAEEEGRIKVTVAEAIAILKLTPSAKGMGMGRGRGYRIPEEPPIEEVRASILRKLDAIEAHEKRNAFIMPAEAGISGREGAEDEAGANPR